MASTFSPILRIELIGTGDQSGTWGNTTNINLGTLIEQAIAGTATIDVTAANVTLTNFNGTTDEARCAALRVVGTPGVSRNIVAPAVSKIYVVANGSDAAVVLKTSASTGLTVPVGEVYLAYFDTTSADFRLVGRASATTNTANTLVLRDASGNFAAGTITANLTGNVTGNLTGNVTGNVTGNTTGNHIGDVYASNGTSKVLESGTNGTDATFTGNVTGNLTGNADTATTLSATLVVNKGGTGATTSTGTGSVVLSDSPTLVAPNLGTPSAVVLTNATGTANSLNAGLGVNQTWQNVTASRASGTTYTNSTGKPIMVSITATRVNSSSSVLVVVGGVTIFAADSSGVFYGSNNPCFIVPAGATYVVTFGGVGIGNWAELR